MGRTTRRRGSVIPEGTVTMLLTDVEGSTVLWEEHPHQMREAMRRHHELGLEAILRHSGYLPPDQGEGDSLFAVFADARKGLECALEFQRSLAKEGWPEGITIRVRAALHTGSLELRDGGNYEGLPLNRCARLRSIAHGGQTVVSNATSSVLGGDLPDLATLEDLGVHRLKDLSIPEHVFQLLHPDLFADFPPLRSLDTRPNNLPLQLTRFVGRIHELPEVEALLGRTKVLTLTGAGGSGKTRLALQVAADRLDDYPAGVWFVELDRVADPALVPRALATAMKVREQPGRTIVETLVDQLGDGVSMVILDNCEHLIDACAELAATLVAACPQLTLFATSREPLSISGEVAWTVPPLAEAVHLFVDRAVAANPRFALDDATAPAVTTICSRLDGIPLAIELAAARVRTMTAQDISRRLDDGFRLLTTGSRMALPRHQTLRATIDWSYDLLSLPEQIVFRRLSVFAGGLTLDAAEQVCVGRGVDGAAVLDLVPLLVSRSLVILQEDPGRGRYRVLEPIREYGYAELRAAEEEGEVRERHLRWCIHVAEEAEPELRTGDQVASLDRLQADLDNFRAAFAWSLARSDATSALRLASALLEFWIVRADWSEGREWVEHALALPGEVDPALRARALRAAGELADVLSDYPASAASFEESLALARRVGDDRQIAAALMGLANEAERMGRAKDARPLLEEAVALLRGVGDDPSIARSLGGLAWLEDNYPRARSLWAQHLAARRKLGNREAIAWAVLQVGWAAEGEGDFGAARDAYEESLAIGREIGYQRIIARSLTQLGDTARLQGRLDEARALYEETMPIWREIGHRSGLVDSLRGLGDVAVLEGDHRRAESLLTESLTVAREIGARESEARAIQSLAALSRAKARSVDARARYRDALVLWMEMDHVHGVASCVRGLGETAVLDGSFQRAARLLGAAGSLMDRVGAALPPSEQEDLRAATGSVRAQLGAAGLEDELEAGRALSMEAAARLAMTD
jgi:predicted ATPase/class 3 adenylate cyclase